MRTITASKARQTLPEQLDYIETGEEVLITRHGKVVAVLTSPDSRIRMRNPELWNEAEQIKATLDTARKRGISAKGISKARAEKLIKNIQTDRSAE